MKPTTISTPGSTFSYTLLLLLLLLFTNVSAIHVTYCEHKHLQGQCSHLMAVPEMCYNVERHMNDKVSALPNIPYNRSE